jgi:hypothetical protein
VGVRGAATPRAALDAITDYMVLLLAIAHAGLVNVSVEQENKASTTQVDEGKNCCVRACGQKTTRRNKKARVPRKKRRGCGVANMAVQTSA